ncbi:LPS-assembly lipoprotein LptE precursor [mine drainage metagenome]|uniref:LPS-assembly lipoprotein LptE n=1 Tax=mine drainage metagenome TaxID=410659 RepID=A0A1J5S0F4_9ZZZZ
MRRAIALLSLLLLAACGFQLRGTYQLPFQTLYISLPETSELNALLKRSIVAGSSVRVVDTQKDAQATFLVQSDNQTKNILSISAAGQAQEYQLVRDFRFRLIDSKGRDWLPPSHIVLTRDITFNNDLVLSKASEEVLLWRDIQHDLVQQVLRRLAAAKAPA